VTTADHAKDLARGAKGLVTRGLTKGANDLATGMAGGDTRRRGLWRTVWLMVRNTAVAAFRYRVTGLAAEAAFWALLSLPPLVLGLVGTIGYVGDMVGHSVLNEVQNWMANKAQIVLAQNEVKTVVTPMIHEVITGKRPDIVSIGFLISLWAGSRATNVYVDTITIAYGLSGVRGVIRTRVRSFVLYVVGLLVMIVLIPLLVIGPTMLRRALPWPGDYVLMLYWPTVVLLSILFLAMLYHMSIPVRTSWLRQVPGAVVALLIWVVGSFILRAYLDQTMAKASVYGSLAASIAVLLWLYVAALAVLIGATLNAEMDREWPGRYTAEARAARAAKAAADLRAAEAEVQEVLAEQEAAETSAESDKPSER
jgi:membrane protein